MDNDKFQEAVLKHLAEIGGKLKDHDGRFTTIDQNFPKITTRLDRSTCPRLQDDKGTRLLNHL